MTELRGRKRAGPLARRNNTGTKRRCLAAIPPFDSPLIIRHGRRLGAHVGPALAGYYAYGPLHKQG